MANPYDYRGSGQGFLDDYSNVNAAGAAFQSFVTAMDHAQDQKQKRLEQAAQIEAIKTKTQREQFQNDLDAAKEGYKRAADGTLQETALSPKMQGQNQLKAIGEGVKPTAFDEYGNPTAYAADENSPKMVAARAQQAMAGRRLDMTGARLDETRNQNAAKAGKNIDDDTVMKDMQTARYSLSRGKALLEGNSPLTYNNLNAVQQDIINGMTKGGQSSEGKVNREMQESWIGRWNNVMAKAGKYGPDNDIRKQDPGLYKQVQSLLNEVDGTISQNMSDRFNTLSTNYGQSTNQKVRATIAEKKKKYAPEQAPQGLVPQGMIKPGMVSPAEGQAAALAQTHPEKNVALEWAKGNPSDPRAQEILKRLGQ